MPLAVTCVQLEGLFFSQLLLEIQKVNAYYLGRADQIGERLEQVRQYLIASNCRARLSSLSPSSPPRPLHSSRVLEG